MLKHPTAPHGPRIFRVRKGPEDAQLTPGEAHAARVARDARQEPETCTAYFVRTQGFKRGRGQIKGY